MTEDFRSTAAKHSAYNITTFVYRRYFVDQLIMVYVIETVLATEPSRNVHLLQFAKYSNDNVSRCSSDGGNCAWHDSRHCRLRLGDSLNDLDRCWRDWIHVVVACQS